MGIGLRFLFLTVSLFSWGCASSSHSTSQASVYQYGTLDLLLSGAYDGQFSWDDVMSTGNLGLGTFEKLDGEAVVLDGTVWQVRSDGSISPAPQGIRTPYATVVNFEPEHSFSLEKPFTLAELKDELDRQVPNQLRLVAFRIHGVFSSVTTRSVPVQEKPYRPLAEVVTKQSVFTASDIRGTLVGFRAPSSLRGIRTEGYHLHFISDNRTIGGHVLDLVVTEGECSFLETNKLKLSLADDYEEAVKHDRFVK